MKMENDSHLENLKEHEYRRYKRIKENIIINNLRPKTDVL